MTLERLLEQALAFAHAALDEPTPERIAAARGFAQALLQRRRFTLAEARLATQLKEVLSALDDPATELPSWRSETRAG